MSEDERPEKLNFSVYVETTIRNRVKAIADLDRRSLSQTIEDAMREFADRREASK